MSMVRRARIKGVVAALPVRRKNADLKLKSPSASKVEESEQKHVPNLESVPPVVRGQPAEDAPAEDWSIQNYRDKPPPDVENASVDNFVAIIEQPSELAHRTQNDDVRNNSEERMGAVDGIVPLATPARARTLEHLKNEIISENAEVLFDPILPLPSPSKPRPKLRPAPRLSSAVPPRRSSLLATGSPLRHSSASESEEEGRRSQVISGRVSHDSSSTQAAPVGPSAAPAAAAATPISHPPGSPVKSGATKARRGVAHEEASRRRLKQNGLVQRDQLTMYDLIFYNPTTNPIRQEDIKKTESAEAVEDSKEAAKESEQAMEEEAVAHESAPAPQLKIGADGSVVVDERSLVIAPTWTQRKLSNTVVQESEAVRSGGRYSRQARTKPWSDADTLRFYRALAAIGTDFSLMSPLFPERTRRDIKIKFKKEERCNCAQVERALASRCSFDVEALAADFARERRDAERRVTEQAERAKRMKREERERTAQVRKQGMKLSKGNRAAIEALPDRRPSTAPASAADLLALAEADACCPALRPSRTKKAKPAPAAAMPPVSPRVVAARAGAVAPGSVVCLAIPDPLDPTRRVLQTYLADPDGRLRSVAVPPAALARLSRYLPGTAAPEPVTQTSS